MESILSLPFVPVNGRMACRQPFPAFLAAFTPWRPLTRRKCRRWCDRGRHKSSRRTRSASRGLRKAIRCTCGRRPRNSALTRISTRPTCRLLLKDSFAAPRRTYGTAGMRFCAACSACSPWRAVRWPPSELQQITGASLRDLDQKGIPPVRHFLLEADGGYSLYHASFHDFVARKLLYPDELRGFHAKSGCLAGTKREPCDGVPLGLSRLSPVRVGRPCPPDRQYFPRFPRGQRPPLRDTPCSKISNWSAGRSLRQEIRLRWSVASTWSRRSAGS